MTTVNATAVPDANCYDCGAFLLYCVLSSNVAVINTILTIDLKSMERGRISRKSLVRLICLERGIPFQTWMMLI